MTLLAIGLLMILSVLGAFFGAQQAKLFFNSIPLVVYWFGLALLLTACFIKFPRMLRKPGLFMIHLGCLLVLAGGLWSSQMGHQLGERLFGIRKIPSGYMVIFEGDTENHIMQEDFKGRLGELPFGIKLNDFRLEYYEADVDSVPRLYIQTKEGLNLQLAAKVGEEISLGLDESKLKVLRTFKNFKILTENGQMVIKDGDQGGENPAVEVEIEIPDGNSYTRFVFENFRAFNLGQNRDGLQLGYVSKRPPIVSGFFSDVVIIENGKDKISKTIEVNRPLHYGGYHFYQNSYDAEAGEYTILSVVSDSGLYGVYAGYWLLCLGVLWQFWLRRITPGVNISKAKTKVLVQ